MHLNGVNPITRNELEENLKLARDTIASGNAHIARMEKAMRDGLGPFDLEEIRIQLWQLKALEKALVTRGQHTMESE